MNSLCDFHQVLKQNHKYHYPTSGYWKQICISLSGTEISLSKYSSQRAACASLFFLKTHLVGHFFFSWGLTWLNATQAR